VNNSELRQDIDRLIASGDGAAASHALRELWAAAPSAGTASFVVSRYERLRPRLELRPYRLAILRSFTVEPIVPLLRASAFTGGIDLTVHVGGFNTHVQEILDPGSGLYRCAPDAAILAVQTRDVAPDLWREFTACSTEDIQAAVARVTGEFRAWVRAFRERSEAALVIHSLEQPEWPSRGMLDAQSADGQAVAIQQINQRLRSIAAEDTGVHILDYEAPVARHGRGRWHGERKWLTVRLPIAAENLPHLADEWLRVVHPLAGRLAKALIVDLDNTLWGGVIGEDGLAGIRLGGEYPAAAYQEVQRALLDLHRRGIVLGVCSKNDRDDAVQALRGHPGMLLGPAHFAAMRINWADKAQNLREIAAELNIGVDAVAFLDDSPLEREQVRRHASEVFVIDAPADPMGVARAIRECPMFERLSLTAEDQQRGAHYRAQRERAELEHTVSSREDFYGSLRPEAAIAPLGKATLSRIAQLVNKTNQFNLTTRRYTEQELAALVSSPDWCCFSITVRDRFGDNGLVGVAITHRRDDTCQIDTLLLSCRVIGRTVETAFLSFLVDHARKQGAERLQGWFLPTRKNAPVRDFYREHGFRVVEENGPGALWALDLADAAMPCPEWVRVHIVEGEKE
jgi:FkbH-like protein